MSTYSLLLDEPVEPKSLMRPYGLFYLYRRRLRQHKTQELFAGIGIAVAVALVFATLVASGSIAGSAAQVVHKVIGRADLQLRSLGPEGFDEHMLSSVERLPGVKQAAPLLEVPATIVAPNGRQLQVTVLGADIALGTLDGLAHTVPGALFSDRAVGLSSASARALRIAPGSVESPSPPQVTIKIRGSAFPLTVSAVLGREAAGALSGVLSAAMPLEVLQAISGLKGRVSRILVQSQPGRRAQVQHELNTLAAGRVAVVPADQDITLLDQALVPGNLASAFFAVIAALLGFLLAFNAVLLTVPERRAQIARLRLGGARRTALVQLLLFQALCLGIAASLIGLALGYVLALAVFHQSPGYLAQAFVLGTGIVVGVGPPLLALAGGILATCLASMVPALDLRRGRALDAVYVDDGDPGNAVSETARVRLAAGACALLAFATAIFLLVPSLALAAGVAVAAACVLAMPLVFVAVLGAGRYISSRSEHLTILPVAVMSLRKTTLRSLALVMTGAVALFGSVTLAGVRADLLKGLGGLAQAASSTGAIWVLNPRDVTDTSSFLAGDEALRMERVPGVARVYAVQGGFLNLGDRRVAIFARPARTGRALLGTQIVIGNARTAERELEDGGWIAVSQQLAAEHHLRVGGTFDLRAPTGAQRFRVAALTTNFGWPGGALLMNTQDSSRLLATSAPTALVAELTPGTSIAQARSAIAATLGPNSGLEAMTAHTGLTRFSALLNEGLIQLQWISVMLVLAAILAMAAALAADIWQQRPWLSGLRLGAVPLNRLRRILLMRSALTLGAGCLAGVLAGIYGQVILDTYLKQVTGFPVITLANAWLPLATFAVVVLGALALAAIPTWFALRAPLALALERQ